MSDPLDIERHDQLAGYLRDTGRIGTTEKIECRTLAGGVSNRTVWVRRAGGDEWVIKQALAKLRVKVDWFSDPSRIHREASALRWLPKLVPPGTITPLIFEDEENHLLAMAAVKQPHENWKTMLLAGRVNQQYVTQFAEILGAIHRASTTQAGLFAEFDNRSFFESLRIEPYYAYSAEQAPQATGFIAALIDETRARRMALVHGDFSPKNILVQGDRLVLLDHEVIHWGDPAFDVGFAMTHFLSKAHHLPQLRKEFVKSAITFAVMYEHFAAHLWNENLHHTCIRHTLACLLARVVGRSPLEYLDDVERDRQRRTVLLLMQDQPATLTDLVSRFLHGEGSVSDES